MATGNVNVSRFADKIVGIGGFVNISQNAKKVIFSGTFTAGGLKVAAEGGKLRILEEGKHRKFVKAVQQICFNGKVGAARGQQVIYVTERAVFRLDVGGPVLIEIAPGLDLASDILAHMDFKPKVSPSLNTMDARIFDPRPMGLASDLAGALASSFPADAPRRLILKCSGAAMSPLGHLETSGNPCGMSAFGL